jgi:hypothetical protein
MNERRWQRPDLLSRRQITAIGALVASIALALGAVFAGFVGDAGATTRSTAEPGASSGATVTRGRGTSARLRLADRRLRKLAGTVRVVTYDGLRLDVPSDWPVVRLDQHPRACVLLNRHALYLGEPGTDESCPARALGRAAALWIRAAPRTGSGATTAGVTGPDTLVGSAALPELRVDATTLPINKLPASPIDHSWNLLLSSSGILITASYGRRLTLARDVLSTVELLPQPPSRSTLLERPSSRPPARVRGAPSSPLSVTAPLPGGAGGGAPDPPAPPPTTPPPTISGLTSVLTEARGFDTCNAPSLSSMQAWLASPYRVAGTYLGGVNWACTYGNFNATWVESVAAMGWRIIPIYVGLQAPCSTIPDVVTMSPSDAAGEGTAAAANAVSLAAAFGYGSTTPIYFDMEGYDSANASCSAAVVTFLGAWTAGLEAAGYQSGVYSSASSGIVDLVAASATPGYPSPQDLWIADWNGDPVTTDSYLSDAVFDDNQRIHQYYGAHTETWGGVTIDIDSDVADGATAGLGSAVTSGAGGEPAYLLAEPSLVAIPAGGSATISLDAGGLPSTSPGSATGTPTTPAAPVPPRPTSVSWSAAPPADLALAPTSGALIVPTGGTTTASVTITVAPGLAPRTYEVPISAESGSEPLAGTDVLVTVTAAPAGTTGAPTGSPPISSSPPVVLYAATPSGVAAAQLLAAEAGLGPSAVVGSYDTAWEDLASGQYLVLAVDEAADDALYFDACGWGGPDNQAAGTTPFSISGAPLDALPPPDEYENAVQSPGGGAPRLSAALLGYAISGASANQGIDPAGPVPPTDLCSGSPDVAVPTTS